jgi:hypothetical protein
VVRELQILLNIGFSLHRKEEIVKKASPGLDLDQASSEFCNYMLGEIEKLQTEHFYGGNHKQFPFNTKEEKARLFRAVWDFKGGGGR